MTNARKPIPLIEGYHWQHPLPTMFWPDRYGGLISAEDRAVALAVVEMVDAWRRNDPAAVANILRSADILHVAALAAYFLSRPIRHDPNPPAIAALLRERARQNYRVRLQHSTLMGTDWDDGGTADQIMLADLDMITLAELIAADDEHGVQQFIGRTGGIDQTPVFGSASCGTRLLAGVWTADGLAQLRKQYGGQQ
ncbi:hypothetical protein [Mycobacterium gordonae]|uniref:Uncharacterized protein n=1 Tax=Mycobacterium gordonae TaxID=1778 RepID=A0A1X1VLC1_MYCGO|nr:hypothetical protein [Mycobacterium gordonae]MCV7010358.1 hypothetical protein [Mycobacterium gordonae]ODR17165.1 hypothetical protein BHQ23_27340 [Mycobacterium gordonae]ORV69866.1 hypothetical protein AWC08_06045 [Mycobacterium gordonae]